MPADILTEFFQIFKSVLRYIAYQTTNRDISAKRICTSIDCSNTIAENNALIFTASYFNFPF